MQGPADLGVARPSPFTCMFIHQYGSIVAIYPQWSVSIIIMVYVKFLIAVPKYIMKGTAWSANIACCYIYIQTVHWRYKKVVNLQLVPKLWWRRNQNFYGTTDSHPLSSLPHGIYLDQCLVNPHSYHPYTLNAVPFHSTTIIYVQSIHSVMQDNASLSTLMLHGLQVVCLIVIPKIIKIIGLIASGAQTNKMQYRLVMKMSIILPP